MVAAEADWPQLGFATGFRNSTMPGLIRQAGYFIFYSGVVGMDLDSKGGSFFEEENFENSPQKNRDMKCCKKDKYRLQKLNHAWPHQADI